MLVHQSKFVKPACIDIYRSSLNMRSNLQANYASTSIQVRKTCLYTHLQKFVKHAFLLLGMLRAPAYAWCATCSQKQAAEAIHATSVASHGMQASTVPAQPNHIAEAPSRPLFRAANLHSRTAERCRERSPRTTLKMLENRSGLAMP